ncbi:hypothetical protein [Streptomyces sp. NEAU-S77]|uniref:hypothetical protein n=1 Tax=Streptomyces sp. NEAU-S77 TaxID=3411033 RepID=UPI003B9FF994
MLTSPRRQPKHTVRSDHESERLGQLRRRPPYEQMRQLLTRAQATATHDRSVRLPLGPAEVSAGAGRIRFPLVRWVLAPRTTWQARRLAAAFGPGKDARTVWALARLREHPEEDDYAKR